MLPPGFPRARLALAVAAAWLLAGTLWGAQTALGSTLTGAAPVPLLNAVRGALVQTLPWIPVTLAVIALTLRFPVTRDSWRRHLPVHLVGAPSLAFLANVLVVLGFWASQGSFRGVGTLVREGARWATVNFHIALLIYVAILLMTQGVVQYRAARERELRYAKLEGQLSRAHLQALNAQIRPHFLFNTLHTIGQMWRSGRSDEADAVLDRLGALFQRVQRSTSTFEIPLHEELDIVREYLAIEQARFRDRLQASVCATDEALGWMVPPLILQPIVENAIRHGFSAVSSASVVEVAASVTGGVLTLSVRDDGPGMRAAPSKPGTSTGLRNTRERLQALYGDKGEMRIEDAPATGTIVHLLIPASDAVVDAQDTNRPAARAAATA